MPNIPAVSQEAANPQQAELLNAIQAKLGMVPNFLKTFAQSPAALSAFLGLHGIAGGGDLDQQTRERIAIAIAQRNSCQYCLSAHTAIGRKAGLTGAEIEANRDGASQDAKAAVAVNFALALVDEMGAVSADQIETVRRAGFSDAEIVEIITHVGLNLLTNIFNKAGQVDIDFPKVDLARAA
jgi:uncharacterized peroxidase-related enzyme